VRGVYLMSWLIRDNPSSIIVIAHDVAHIFI
jgi:hypothetical protein